MLSSQNTNMSTVPFVNYETKLLNKLTEVEELYGCINIKINGRNVSACKNWIMSCLDSKYICKTTCNNYHSNKRPCKFFMLSRCKNASCSFLHLEELNFNKKSYKPITTEKIDRPESITEQNSDGFINVKYTKKPKSTVNEGRTRLLTIRGNKVQICVQWINFCSAEFKDKNKYICSGNCYHDSLPICFKFLKGKCMNTTCNYHHPPELMIKTKQKLSMCMSELLHYYNPKNEKCQYGTSCNYAHDESEMVPKYELSKAKTNLQEMFINLHQELTTYWVDIKNVLRENDRDYPQDLPKLIPNNFINILKIWITFSKIRNAHFRLNIIDEDLLWEINNSMNICPMYYSSEINRLIGTSCSKEQICPFGINCKYGVHNISRMICTKDLCNQTCNCCSNNTTTKQDILDKIKKLQDTRQILIDKNKHSVDTKIQIINQKIKNYAEQYVITGRPRHLVSDEGFEPINIIKKSIIQEFPLLDCFYELEKSTHIDVKSTFVVNPFLKKYNKAMNLIKNAITKKLYKMRCKNKSNPNYIISEAFKFMTLKEYIRDVDIYNQWVKYPIGFDCYYDFIPYYRDQLINYDNLGTTNSIKITKKSEKKKEEKISSTSVIIIPSEKENYKDFHGWLAKVLIWQDPTVIGNCDYIVKDKNDEIFFDYYEKNVHNNFKTTLAEWINSNPLLCQIVPLIVSSKLPYYIVKKYITLNIKEEINMDLDTFSNYNPEDIKEYIIVNKDKKSIGSEPIDLKTFLPLKNEYSEFYGKGLWKYFNGSTGFETYISSLKEGWSYTKIIDQNRASFQDNYLKKLQEKEEKKLLKDKTTAEYIANINNPEIANKIAPKIQRKKNTQIKKTVESDTESDSSSDSSSDSDSDSSFSSDSDSDSEDNNLDEIEHNILNPFSTKKTDYEIPLMSKMECNTRFHIYSEDNELFFGPFSENISDRVKAMLYKFNASEVQGHRPIQPKIRKEKGDEDFATSYYITCGLGFTNSKAKKMSKYEGNPYEWVLYFVYYLCNSYALDEVTQEIWNNILKGNKPRNEPKYNMENFSSNIIQVKNELTTFSSKFDKVKETVIIEDIKTEVIVKEPEVKLSHKEKQKIAFLNAQQAKQQAKINKEQEKQNKLLAKLERKTKPIIKKEEEPIIKVNKNERPMLNNARSMNRNKASSILTEYWSRDLDC